MLRILTRIVGLCVKKYFFEYDVCVYTVNLWIPLSWGYTCRIMPSLVDHLNNNNRASFEASELKHNVIIFISSSEKEKGRKKKRRIYTGIS